MNPTQAKILVPVDGSEFSLHALDVAADLAAALGSELVILHVVDLARVAMLSGGEAQLIPGCLAELESEGRGIVEDARHRVPGGVRVSTRVSDGMPIEQIELAADEIRPAFIVIGTHGRRGVNRAIMGSVAEGVARGARFPVMVVPRLPGSHSGGEISGMA